MDNDSVEVTSSGSILYGCVKPLAMMMMMIMMMMLSLLCSVASRYDVWMILSQCTFNTKLRLHHSYNGTVLSMDDWAQFNTDSSHFESAFEIQSRLQSLHLSTEENCVLAAFTVMSTGTYTLVVVVAVVVVVLVVVVVVVVVVVEPTSQYIGKQWRTVC